MIWIRNHGIRGESDNLRIPLSKEIPEIIPWSEDAEKSQKIVKINGWTGIDLGKELPDQEIEESFSKVLGEQLIWAYKQESEDPGFENKAEELDTKYKRTLKKK